jgi:hypothetical protein
LAFQFAATDWSTLSESYELTAEFPRMRGTEALIANCETSRASRRMFSQAANPFVSARMALRDLLLSTCLQQ